MKAKAENKRLDKRWKRVVFRIAVAMLAVGLARVLFPRMSNFIGKLIAAVEADEFDERIANIADGSYEDALNNGEIDDEGYPIDEDGNRTSDNPLYFQADLDRLLEDSLAYNENLKVNQNKLLVSNYSYTQASLNLADYGIYNGIYGYVSTPTIDMKLPIYLGANNSTMSYGAAHLTYTSQPTRGESTNTVLAGHTGYIGRIFFDNLRNLQIGDEVTVTNYWETLEYEVVRTEVHAPDEAQGIFITEGEDMLTMLTCINGGSSRYYVICERKD
ncbi:MAG: class C sortase [Clostridiales bacterium]|nr:class C sortase [Clostridiales bacterium]